MSERPASRRDRGLETVVSHVLSVAITTILIIGLVASATGYLDAQKQQAAAQELRTIGNRLASDLATADRLARTGDAVELVSRQPESVAGSLYTVTLLQNCPSAGSKVCVRISADSYDFTTLVPVENETRLSMTAEEGGRFRITSVGGAAAPARDPRGIDMNPRVGIGGEVGVGAVNTGATLSRSPIARFDFTPANPSTGQQIEFDGSPSRDPDGSISAWEWDFDDDGTTDLTGPNPTYIGYSNPGAHNVTLTVEDDGGLKSSYTRAIDVSGLRYRVPPGLDVLSTNDEAVQFSLESDYTQTITVERVLIDPADDSLNDLEIGPTEREIEIDNTADGGLEGYVEWSGGSLAIPDDGAIVDISEDGDSNGGDVSVDSGERVRITLREFDNSMGGEDLTLGVRYRIGDDVDATVFTDTAT